MKDVAFGQYYPSSSFTHKLDPRTKFLFLIVYIAAIFTADNFYGLGACAVLFLLAACCSGVPFGSILRSIKAVLFLLVFTAILNLFFYTGNAETETPLLEWKFITIWPSAVRFSVFLCARLFLLVVGSSILTLTTTPVALTDGVESLLSPLKLIKFPVHVIARIMSIALSFIPVFTEETARIMNAQKARGADFESGSLIKRVKAIIPVLIPLLISAFRRAEELGDAMEARCYSGSTVRTKYKKLKFGWRDLVAGLFAIALLVGVILLRVML